MTSDLISKFLTSCADYIFWYPPTQLSPTPPGMVKIYQGLIYKSTTDSCGLPSRAMLCCCCRCCPSLNSPVLCRNGCVFSVTLISLCKAGFLQAPKCPPMETAGTFGVSLASSHPYTVLQEDVLRESTESPCGEGPKVAFSGQQLKSPRNGTIPSTVGRTLGKDSSLLCC